VARLQTAGKGRGRNDWWAADGALTFSLLLDRATTGIQPDSWPQFSLTTAVAVCEGLASFLPLRGGASSPAAGLNVKWPNDVLLGGRKVCGILIESPSGAAPAKDRLIAGIGINVNNSWHAAPPHMGRSGTALCDVTGESHDLQAVIVRVLNALRNRVDQLRSGDAELIGAWQRFNGLAGRNVTVESDGRWIGGRCHEIAQDGALVVNTPSGQQRFYSGSVRLA
jgi:BirA family biotin operon repressor/biotin-[acetyl-CoA-carboxylase] ligase